MAEPQWSDLYGIDPEFTADQPVTPDREALIAAADDALSAAADCCLSPQRCLSGAPDRIVDALLPLLTDALDRARQQGKREGRDEAAQAIEAKIPDEPTDKDDWDLQHYASAWESAMRHCAELARSADDRKAAE